MIEVKAKNDNSLVKAIKELVETYEEEFSGTITIEITKLKSDNSQLGIWKKYVREAYRNEEDDYCTKWSRGFKEDNPLSKKLMYYMDNNERHTSIDMIDQLEDTLLNELENIYGDNVEIEDGVEGILSNPEKYPVKLVEDLLSVVKQYYKFNPLFKWDW